jgi:Family of unknown function (DUF5681)
MVARSRLNPSSTRKYKPNYRKPPKDKQYKPGQSGNPTGRPKGVRNLKTDLLEELRTLVEVPTTGGVRRITTQKAILRALVEKARDGDVRAIQHLTSLIDRLFDDDRSEAPATVLESNDRAILDEYYEERKALEANRATSGSVQAEPAVANPATTDREDLA